MQNISQANLKSSQQLEKNQEELWKRIAPMTTEQEKKAILYTIHPTIKELKIDVIQNVIADSIYAAYLIRGIGNVDGKQVVDMTKILSTDIIEQFKGFRLPEIATVIENGAKGMYERDGDLTTVSVELILKWIRRYSETTRKEALHKQRVHEEKQADLITEQNRIEGEKGLKIEIDRIYLEFCNGTPLKESINVEYPIALLAVYYKFLDRLELIELSNAIKNRLFDNATKEISSERPERSEKKLFDLFNRTKEAQIKDLARYYALENQFELWQMEGKQIIFN